MESYLPISYLNDYVFCPYSIYLHNVYKGGEEDLYHTRLQSQGRNAHASIDQPANKKAASRDLTGLEVYSQELGLMGKIDLYRFSDKSLIERKKKISRIYQGQIWQLQAQYLCMTEMGHEIDKLQIHSLDDNKSHPVSIPGESEIEELRQTINQIKDVTRLDEVTLNPNKCMNCIYNNLCDKAEVNNVY